MPVWLDSQKEGNVRIYEAHGYVERARADQQGIPFSVVEQPRV